MERSPTSTSAHDAIASARAGAHGAARPHRDGSYGPTAWYARQRDQAERPPAAWTTARLGLRVRSDAQLLLAVAVAIPVLVMQVAGSSPSSVSLLAPIVFLAAQAWLTTLRAAPPWLPTARLGLSMVFIASANLWGDPTGMWPLTALAIPLVAFAAASGGPGPTLIALAGMALIFAPLGLANLEVDTRQEVAAVAMAAVVLALGSRRVVANLERSSARLRRANARARRRARELAAVESVGRMLARDGFTPATLDRVMALLEQVFGYQYPSVYTWDGSALQLGAQRNYRTPIQTIAPDRGILGRVVRTRDAVFLPDARSDPDFLSADPDVVSEISIPLESDDELLGILNVETSGSHRLDEDDFATMQIVADRLSAALALGRERLKLTERAALLDRLTVFATQLGSSLDPASMDDEVARGAASVVPASMVVLVQRDDTDGNYRVSAVSGGDHSVVGREIEPGEGVSGRAVLTRSVVAVDRLDRALWPKAVAGADLPDVLSAMAAPMITDDEVVGAVSWFRGDVARPFTNQEREVAGLLARQVGLALSNARLHEQTRYAAITDPLTGLHNRRHFDAALERDDALRQRVPAERRPLRSAILYDLDHFGRINKRHGHQVGDRVLRLFADTLRARSRASDLLARYGGEEFVVVLADADREAAAAIAEEVRTAFATQTVELPGGGRLSTTVSAGCATLEALEVEGSLLLERADVALAMAKAAGRDKVVTA